MTVSEEMEENLGDGQKKRSDSNDSRDKNSRKEKSKHLSKVSKFFFPHYFNFVI